MTTTNQTSTKPAAPAEPTEAPLFARSAGVLAIAAGTLMIIAQLIWWPFDQEKNLTTSQNGVFNAGTLIYLAGFYVLVFALIGVHGLQASKAGRLGTFGFSAALIGTLLLSGDLWWESFAVPWLAEAAPKGLESDPAMLMALGAISSYFLFAFGWAAFGLASLRARVFPAWISLLIAAGGIVGFNALLAPGGILFGVAIATLGVWVVHARFQAARNRVDEQSASMSS